MNKKLTALITLGTLALIATPFVADAAVVNNLSDLSKYVISILNLIIPILFGLGVVVFFWGTIKFLISAGNEKERAEAKYLLIYGVIGLVVMASVWGIVNVVTYTLFGSGLPGASANGNQGSITATGIVQTSTTVTPATGDPNPNYSNHYQNQFFPNTNSNPGT